MDEIAPARSALESAPLIEVTCLACGREAAFDEGDVRVAGTPLAILTRRLLCSACGSRAVRATRVASPRDIARRIRGRMGTARD